MLCSLLTEHFFVAAIEGCEEPRGRALYRALRRLPGTMQTILSHLLLKNTRTELLLEYVQIAGFPISRSVNTGIEHV